MNHTSNSTNARTAADVMTRTVVSVHHRTPLRAAARTLAWHGGELLAVTDDTGRFLGVLTTANLLGWALGTGPDGGQHHDTSAWMDWQLMAPEQGRTDEVRWHLADDPVVVDTETPLAELAERLRDRRPCCAVVLDESGCPVGVVSGGDLLVAAATEHLETEHHPHRTSPDGRWLAHRKYAQPAV